MQTKGLRKL